MGTLIVARMCSGRLIFWGVVCVGVAYWKRLREIGVTGGVFFHLGVLCGLGVWGFLCKNVTDM